MASGELFPRMLRAAKLEPALYEEVEADQGGTGQALLVVVLVSMATGIGHGIGIPPAKTHSVKALVAAFGLSQKGVGADKIAFLSAG